jgi:hypothetical protein
MSTTTDTLNTFTTGARVSGTYCGTEFTGTVISSRGHSLNWSMYKVHIALDTPTVFLGFSPRTSLMVTLDGSGQNHPGNATTITLAAMA